MARIDTSGWKPFVVGELFDIHPTKAYKMTNAQLMDDGDNPVVVNSSYNNGIGGYSSQPVTEKGGVITFSDTTTADAIFYQPNDFVGYPHVQGMYPKGVYAANWKEPQLLFFVATFRKAAVTRGFDYAYKFTREIASGMVVLLPVDKSGNPDWAYMDEYMSKLLAESEKSLEHLRKADGEKHALDVSEWREFSIGDLFEKLQLDVKKTDFNKTFDVSEERTDEFNLPLVNAKHGNNGIMYYGREADFETATMTIDIVQNGAIATGDVYAQPQKTGVLWDAYLIKPKSDIDSVFTLMFLATVLEKAIKDKFSYDDKCVWDRVKMLPVKLPCTCEGIPDWAYMDEYMRTVMKSAQSNLSAMQTSAENCVSSSPDGDDD